MLDLDLGGLRFGLNLDLKNYHANMTEARRGAALIENRLKSLRAAVDSGKLGFDAFAAKLKTVQAAEKQLGAVMQSVTGSAQQQGRAATAAGTAINRGMGKVASGAGRARQGMQGLVYLMDDLQYVPEQGLRPIINNLAFIHPAAGAAALGVELLTRNWTALEEAFGMTHMNQYVSNLESMEAAVKKLGAAAESSALGWKTLETQMSMIEKMKGNESFVKGLKPSPARSPIEEKSGKMFTEAIEQKLGGGEKLRDLLVSVAKQNPRQYESPATRKLREEVEGLQKQRQALRALPPNREVEVAGLGRRKASEAIDLIGRQLGPSTLNKLTLGYGGSKGMEAKLQDAVKADEKNARARMDALIAGASRGGAGEQRTIRALLAKAEVGGRLPLGFAGGRGAMAALNAADPLALKAEENAKNAEKLTKEREQAQKKKDAAAKKAANEDKKATAAARKQLDRDMRDEEINQREWDKMLAEGRKGLFKDLGIVGRASLALRAPRMPRLGGAGFADNGGGQADPVAGALAAMGRNVATALGPVEAARRKLTGNERREALRFANRARRANRFAPQRARGRDQLGRLALDATGALPGLAGMGARLALAQLKPGAAGEALNRAIGKIAPTKGRPKPPPEPKDEIARRRAQNARADAFQVEQRDRERNEAARARFLPPDVPAAEKLRRQRAVVDAAAKKAAANKLAAAAHGRDWPLAAAAAKPGKPPAEAIDQRISKSNELLAEIRDALKARPAEARPLWGPAR